jgi:hypothetical protein
LVEEEKKQVVLGINNEKCKETSFFIELIQVFLVEAAKKQVIIEAQRMTTAKKFQMPYINKDIKGTTPPIQILAQLISLESCLAINVGYFMIVLKHY